MNMTCGRRSSSCAAGASSAASTTITVPSTLAPGTYYIGAVADYTGVQPETNETNNALAAAATVTVNSGIAQAYYIHTDQLDTPRVITDTNGNVVWQWDNADPFGANMANENPNGAGTFNFNLRFPGQYYDRETNLHYNINRDYDPAIGRYIESDPIGLMGGINTFIYVFGNPIGYRDISGLVPRGAPKAGKRDLPDDLPPAEDWWPPI
jgi:RHS repeat-associated protein